MSHDKGMIKNKLKIMIRLDADHHVGLAHAVRVGRILSLGKATYGDDWDVALYLVGNFPTEQNFFDGPLSHQIFEGTEQDKARQMVQAAQEWDADILLIDHPRQSKECWEIYLHSGRPVIAIDDEGGDVQADLIFNGTILDDYHHYPEMSDPKKIKTGAGYALINPYFSAQPWSEAQGEGLITVIGSGDRACQWALKLTEVGGPLGALSGLKKTMIVGGAYPLMEQLSQNCRDQDIILHQGVDQNTMADLLCQHKVGLITGGMIVYEALSCGLPVIIFPQEKNLPPEARYFADNGCAVDLGYDGGMDMTRVQEELVYLMGANERRNSLSKTARTLIDGKGMSRTIDVMNGFFQSVKNTTNQKERS